MSARNSLNLERPEPRALKVHPKTCVCCKLNLKRAHPPIPPRGRALKLRPRELEARARSRFALEVQIQDQAEGPEPGSIRYSRADERRRRQREQPPTTTDFLSVGRSGLAARRGHTTSLSISCPAGVQFLANLALRRRVATLARVVAAIGLATAPTTRNLGHTGERRPTWAKHAMNTLPAARTGPGFPARRQPA